MSGSTPWWYSGADDAAADAGATSGRGDTAGSRPRFDIAGLATGAQQLVDLARQALIAPHAGHGDPREHPECVICRALTAFGDTAGPGSAMSGSPVIEWIDLEPPRR